VTAAAEVARTGAAAHAVDDRLGAAGAAARGTFYHGSGGSHSLLWEYAARVLRWLSDHLGVGPGAVSVGGVLRLAALVVLVAGAAALVARLAPRRLPGRRGAAGERRPPAAVAPRFEQSRDAALRIAAADPREALRLLHAALLAEVGRRHGWRPLPGRTNWGFVRALGTASEPGRALADGTRIVERSVYGDEPASVADVHRLDELGAAVLA
jgi:Domain of unknown function (DUF4129)